MVEGSLIIQQVRVTEISSNRILWDFMPLVRRGVNNEVMTYQATRWNTEDWNGFTQCSFKSNGLAEFDQDLPLSSIWGF